MKKHQRATFGILLLLTSLVPGYLAAQATIAQQISMARELIPTIKTITVVCNVDEVQPILKEMKAATTSAGLGLSVFDVKSFPELFSVVRSMSSKKVDLLWMVPDSLAGDKSNRRFLEETCIRQGIPSYAFSKDVLHEGALLYMSMENNQPVYFVNKAAASVMGFKVPPQMESKITQTD